MGDRETGGGESVSVSTQVSRTRSKVQFHCIIVNTFHCIFVSHSHSEDFYFVSASPTNKFANFTSSKVKFRYIVVDAFYHGVATISGFLKITGLFRKRALQKRLYSAKGPCNLRSLLNVATPYILVNDSNSHGSYFGSTSPTNNFASLTSSKVLVVSLAQAASTTVLVFTESDEGHLNEIGNSNPEIPPRKSEFPIFYNLRITGLFFEKERYTRIPRTDPGPFKSLHNF